ncbi:MAG: hypothetical protein AAGE84_14490 [Cyanobacteria bacterium P01_G01_bin.39]
MTIEEQSYKLKVLKYAVNQCVNRLLPKNSKDALSIILYQSNEVVWRVATDIYSKSGYQIDFIFIKNILNLRIEPLRNEIAEEERTQAKLEAERLAREAEEQKIRKHKEAEEERIRAKLEMERLAREAEEQKQLQQFKEANPDIDINDYQNLEIFTKLKRIIIEQLQVEEELITLDLVLFEWNYFGNNENKDLDLVEFIMAIEEEFDIEIPDEEQERFWNCSFGEIINFVLQKV